MDFIVSCILGSIIVLNIIVFCLLFYCSSFGIPSMVFHPQLLSFLQAWSAMEPVSAACMLFILFLLTVVLCVLSYV
jgi:hypothetical protein